MAVARWSCTVGKAEYRLTAVDAVDDTLDRQGVQAHGWLMAGPGGVGASMPAWPPAGLQFRQKILLKKANAEIIEGRVTAVAVVAATSDDLPKIPIYPREEDREEDKSFFYTEMAGCQYILVDGRGREKGTVHRRLTDRGLLNEDLFTLHPFFLFSESNDWFFLVGAEISASPSPPPAPASSNSAAPSAWPLAPISPPQGGTGPGPGAILGGQRELHCALYPRPPPRQPAPDAGPEPRYAERERARLVIEAGGGPAPRRLPAAKRARPDERGGGSSSTGGAGGAGGRRASPPRNRSRSRSPSRRSRSRDRSRNRSRDRDRNSSRGGAYDRDRQDRDSRDGSRDRDRRDSNRGGACARDSWDRDRRDGGGDRDRRDGDRGTGGGDRCRRDSGRFTGGDRDGRDRRDSDRRDSDGPREGPRGESGRRRSDEPREGGKRPRSRSPRARSPTRPPPWSPRARSPPRPPPPPLLLPVWPVVPAEQLLPAAGLYVVQNGDGILVDDDGAFVAYVEAPVAARYGLRPEVDRVEGGAVLLGGVLLLVEVARHGPHPPPLPPSPGAYPRRPDPAAPHVQRALALRPPAAGNADLTLVAGLARADPGGGLSLSFRAAGFRPLAAAPVPLPSAYPGMVPGAYVELIMHMAPPRSFEVVLAVPPPPPPPS
eukprot:tig00000630_g2694.t1